MKKLTIILIFLFIIPHQAHAGELNNRWLEHLAVAKGVPVEIIKGIAEVESNCQQFYEGTDIPVIEPFWNDPEGADDYLSTIKKVYQKNWWREVAHRGLGIMQVTPAVSYEVYDKQLINKLLYDMVTNISEGTELLYYGKWLNDKIPSINSHDPRFLEDWFFAVQAYNGWYGPGETQYAEKVFSEIYKKLDLHCSPAVEYSVSEGVYKSACRTQSRDYITYKGGDLCIVHHPGITGVNLRQKPSTNSPITGKVYFTDLLQITDDEVTVSYGYLWQKVRCISAKDQNLKGREGYVAIKYLRKLDWSGDGLINLPDLVMLARQYGKTIEGSDWQKEFDLDFDGKAGLMELVILNKHYGKGESE
jgi:hypothetical protein